MTHPLHSARMVKIQKLVAWLSLAMTIAGLIEKASYYIQSGKLHYKNRTKQFGFVQQQPVRRRRS